MSGHVYRGSRHRTSSSPPAVVFALLLVAFVGALALFSTIAVRQGPAGTPATFITPAPERPAAGLVDHPGEPLPTAGGQYRRPQNGQ